MKKLLLAILASVVLARPTPAQEGPKLIIGNIQITGNRSVTTTQILSQIRSRTGDAFDESTAAQDAKRIAELPGVEYCYYNTSTEDDKTQLTFIVVEKNLIRAISFQGNRRIKEKKLQKLLSSKVGNYLDPVLAEADRKALVDYYHKNGFAFAKAELDSQATEKGKLVFVIEEGSRVKIKSVKIVGNTGMKSKSIKKVLKIDDKNWLLWPKDYNEEKIAQDLTKLQNIYYENGFLNASIAVEQQYNGAKTQARVTFNIKEGPAYIIENINISEVEHFDKSKLQTSLKTQKGKVYNGRLSEADVKTLLRLYHENGFVDAKVDKEIKFISSDRVNLELTVSEGERFRIGQINITGNENTQDKVIRRILDECDFVPGGWYNADIARGDGSGKLEKEIRQMALTESATITPAGEKTGQRDAQVSIIEGQTGMVMLGAGVSSDSGLMGQFVFEQRNFDLGNRPKSFKDLLTGKAFKGGGQTLRVALQPGTEVSEYSISFTEPYMWNKPISLDVIGSSWERGRECYDEERTRGFFAFEKRYKNKWRRSIGLKWEDVTLSSLDTDAPKEVVDDEGGNTLMGIRLGIGRDLTDDRFTPSTGDVFDVGYEHSAGDHNFGKASTTYRKYFTIHEDLAERKTILAARLHGATAIGDAPVFERFYAGGSESIRGFEYRGISTRGLQRNVANPKRKDPIGSDWIMLASAEAILPVVSNEFGALLFVDSGIIDSGGYRVSVGTGIQILVPQWFGPVPMRFEVAAPIMKNGNDETQAFSFSVGRLF